MAEYFKLFHRFCVPELLKICCPAFPQPLSVVKLSLMIVMIFVPIPEYKKDHKRYGNHLKGFEHLFLLVYGLW